MTQLSRRAALRVGAVSILAPAVVAAQPATGPYPNRPIRFIVPFPPGGSVDPLARIIGQKLSDDLGQQVIVDNRPGGNTVIGTEATAKAPPDGYTILMTATSHVTNPQLVPTSYDPIRDFAPIATLSSSDMVLVVHPSVPARTLQELIALAKARPGQLNFASAGSGNPNHLAGELINMMAGVRTTHVPYKGGAPAVTDLVGGQVQMHYGSPINVLPHIRSGRLRALAVSSPARLPTLPDVPTFAEAGLPGYEIRIWYGVLAPAGTPREVQARLATEINRIMLLPEVKERLDAAGMDRYSLTAEQFASVLRSDMDKFGRIIKAANVKLD